MLKFIYKTLLISVLSCSLMMLDFNTKGITLQSAQAETVKTEGVKDSDMMATLTMTAVGLLASRLYTCKMTADMMVAAAGGAAFIAGEILSTIKLRKVMKDMETEITRDKTGKINEEQVAALERLKKSYEEAKKTAGTKKMLQQAAAAAFAAAAVTAYMLAAQEKTAQATCDAALKAAGTMCPGLGAQTAANSGVLFGLFTSREAPKPSNAGFAAQTTAEGTEKTAEGTSASGAATLSGTYATACAACYGSCPACQYSPACANTPTATFVPACAPITPILKVTTGFCPAPLTFAKNSSGENNFYAKSYSNPQFMAMALVMEMLAPKNAQADLFSPLGIASSAAISYLMYTNASLGVKIDMYLLAPMNRAIIWGVLAGLTYMASSSTDNVIKKIDANIQKIDTILNSMYSLAQGTKGSQTIQTNGTIQTTVKPNTALNLGATDYEAVDLSSQPDGALPCFTAKEGQKCTSMENGLKDLPSFTGLDAESQKQISAIVSASNGLNGTSTISKGTLSSMAGVAGSANAMRANMDKAKNKLADIMKKAGIKNNMDKTAKEFSDSINKSVQDGLKKSGTDANGMMASMYGGRGGLSSSSGSTAAAKTAEEALKKDPVAAANAVNIASPEGAVTIDSQGMSLGANDNKEATAEELAAYNEGTKGAGSMDDYDLKENEISKDSSASIFDLISNRYQRTGYQRLFEKVKAPQPAEAVKN